MKIAFNPTSATSIAPGQYPARLSKVIDLGTQASTFDGKTTWQRKLQASWELHGTGVTRGGNPPTVSEIYTASMHPKAKLRQHLAAYQGREFSHHEANEFDFSEWINRSGLLTIVTNGQYPKITGLQPLSGDHLPVPAVSNPVVFDLNAPDFDVFQKLSEGVRSMISASPEWKRVKDAFHPMTARCDVTTDDGFATLQSKVNRAFAAANAHL